MADSSPRPPSPLGQTVPLVQPLYQTSVYTVPDLDAYDRIVAGEEPGFFYARDAHPNAQQLASQLAALESAPWAAVCGSGMAAITATLLSLIQQGDRIVASNQLYGRTTLLLKQELPRYGVQTTFVDAGDLEAVRSALAPSSVPSATNKPPALTLGADSGGRAGRGVLFVETMSNPLVRLVDLEALAGIARERNCTLVVDNTFATPVLVKPLELGATIVVESLTKMIGGHSDVTLGAVCGSGDALPQISGVISTWGLAANPFDCWLASRGLATLGLRMQAASTNAADLADWLARQPAVSRVVYPGRPDHPDHALARRLLKSGFGNMLCFELAGGRDAVNHFMHQAKGIPFSPSLGHTTTTCSHPAVTSHRYLSPAERKRQGISDGLIRLSVGVEDLGRIQEEMVKGLAGLKAP